MPDFNRPMNYMGVGFNWVPFYAKMSFLGSKNFILRYAVHSASGDVTSTDKIAEKGHQKR